MVRIWTHVNLIKCLKKARLLSANLHHGQKSRELHFGNVFKQHWPPSRAASVATN